MIDQKCCAAHVRMLTKFVQTFDRTAFWMRYEATSAIEGDTDVSSFVEGFAFHICLVRQQQQQHQATNMRPPSFWRTAGRNNDGRARAVALKPCRLRGTLSRPA